MTWKNILRNVYTSYSIRSTMYLLTLPRWWQLALHMFQGRWDMLEIPAQKMTYRLLATRIKTKRHLDRYLRASLMSSHPILDIIQLSRKSWNIDWYRMLETFWMIHSRQVSNNLRENTSKRMTILLGTKKPVTAKNDGGLYITRQGEYTGSNRMGTIPTGILWSKHSSLGNKGIKSGLTQIVERKAPKELGTPLSTLSIGSSPLRVKSKNLDVLGEYMRTSAKNAANFVVIGRILLINAWEPGWLSIRSCWRW